MRKIIICTLFILLLVSTVSALDYTERIYGIARYENGRPVLKGSMITVYDASGSVITNYTMLENGYIGNAATNAGDIIVTISNRTQNIFLYFSVNNSRTDKLLQFAPGERIKYEIIIPGNAPVLSTPVPTTPKPLPIVPAVVFTTAKVTPMPASTPSVSVVTQVTPVSPTQETSNDAILIVLLGAGVIIAAIVICFIIYEYLDNKANEEYVLQENNEYKRL